MSDTEKKQGVLLPRCSILV
jgi:hypothetical protein